MNSFENYLELSKKSAGHAEKLSELSRLPILCSMGDWQLGKPIRTLSAY
jgi:hypothetical protein